MDPDLVEWFAVSDIYADGLASAEMLSGDNVRATYFVYQRAPAGGLVRVVCARIIRPKSSIQTGAMEALLRACPHPLKGLN